MTTAGSPPTEVEDSPIGCFAQGAEGGVFECIIDGTFAAGPAPELMGLLLGGTLVTSMYIAGKGTIAVPSIVTILLGSVMIPLLPEQHITFAYTLVVFGITTALFAVWVRFTHQGGF